MQVASPDRPVRGSRETHAASTANRAAEIATTAHQCFCAQRMQPCVRCRQRCVRAEGVQGERCTRHGEREFSLQLRYDGKGYPS